MTEPAPWRRPADVGEDSPYAGLPRGDVERDYRTLTYDVDGRIARITFNRPEQGNAITPDTPVELAHAVERADLDPRSGGTDIALHADQIVIAADAKIGYPPTRVWGVPSAGLWAHRLGDQRAKRLLLTGDTLNGREAVEWGLAIEAPEPEDLDARTEILVDRIAAMPINQLMMVKLALNSALFAQGVQNSQMVSTVFDGISRHTREGYSFAARAAEVGFRQAVAERDSTPYDDFGPSTNKG
jgi:enoyl-CoA hydratase/carnithine racemase